MKKSTFLIIITMLLALTGTLSAEETKYVFYVDSPEMVDVYAKIFDGFSEIFHGKAGSNVASSYLSILKLTVLFGGFIVFSIGIAESWGRDGKGAISKYAAYVLTTTGILTIIYSDPSTVIIKTNNISSFCDTSSSNTNGYAADGVPKALAYSLSSISKIGYGMTSLAEDLYYGVDGKEMGVLESGGYIGALRDSLKVLMVDLDKVGLQYDKNASRPPVEIGTATRTLLTKCILVPFSAKGEEGRLELNRLKRSKDISGYFKRLYDGNTTVTVGGIEAGNYQAEIGGDLMKCKDIYTTYLKPNIDAVKFKVDCGVNVSKGAIALITGSSSPDVSNLREVSIQAGLVDQLAQASSSLGVDIPGMSYATGKTRAEFIQTNMSTGMYMAEILPYLQMTIRAILYAFFPFVFIVVMLPGGVKVLTQYFKTLLWIELWSPTAAILNMFLNTMAKHDIGSKYSDQGVSLLNSIDMLSAGSTIAGVAGYLYMSVPALTWLILTGSAYMLGSIGSAAAAGMSKNIQTESITQDQSLVKKNQEMKARTGEDISIAETMHFEAISMGTAQGAQLATQSNIGLDSVGNAAAFETSKKLHHANMVVNTVGSAERAGQSTAGTQATQTVADAQYGATVSTGDDHLSNTGQAIVSHNTAEKVSEAEAAAGSSATKQDYSDAAAHNRAEKVIKPAAALKTFKQMHKKLVNRMKNELKMDDKAIDGFLAARMASTGGITESRMNAIAEKTNELISGGHMTLGEDGKVHLDQQGAQTMAGFSSNKANAAVWNDKQNIGKTNELQKENQNPYEIGKQQANALMDTTNRTEARLKMLKQVFDPDGSKHLTKDQLYAKGNQVQKVEYTDNGKLKVSYKDTKTGQTLTSTITAGNYYKEGAQIMTGLLEKTGVSKQSAERLNEVLQNASGMKTQLGAVAASGGLIDLMSGKNSKAAKLAKGVIGGAAFAAAWKSAFKDGGPTTNEGQKLTLDAFISKVSNMGSESPENNTAPQNSNTGAQGGGKANPDFGFNRDAPNSK